LEVKLPIIDQESWQKFVSNNEDPYGRAVVNVARRAMEILDSDIGDFDCNQLLCRADDECKAGGITGFMAGCAANIISKLHSRGEEFRIKWNDYHGVDESRAKGGVVNQAILTVG
jgi:hypothetical protein